MKDMSYIHHDDSNQVTPFAVTNFRDKRVIFGIKRGNRRGHMYVIGKTGTGKSTMLLNMIYADMKTGNGVALIDPHGDLAESVLDLVPENRIEDVIYFNPADMEYPIAFNPLANVKPEYHHLVASGLISVFKKVWPEFWGPRLEHIFRYSIMTLLQYQESTLLDVTRILTDKEFRARILRRVNNPQIQNFWSLEFEKYSAWLKSEAISPILNKVGQFLISPPLSNILGQKENTFKFRKVMDDGKILIVNLAKGKIGEDSSALLGSMMVTMIQLAAQTRAGMPENRRKHFYLYVDEFHNFITMSFADILSEARKYGLNLILAHQYIEQLDEKIRSAAFGNVGTIVSFRIGAEDAKYLAREFYPVFSEEDFVNLPNYHIYLKLMIDGVTSKAFSAVTLSPQGSEESHKLKIIELSKYKYGKPKAEIAREAFSQRQFGSKKTTKQRRLF